MALALSRGRSRRSLQHDVDDPCLSILPPGKVTNPLQKAEAIQSDYERNAFNQHVDMTFYTREKKETASAPMQAVLFRGEQDTDRRGRLVFVRYRTRQRMFWCLLPRSSTLTC